MNKKILFGLIAATLITTSLATVSLLQPQLLKSVLKSASNSLQQAFKPKQIQSPFVNQEKTKELPLLKYAIPNLKQIPLNPKPLNIVSYLEESDQHWVVSFNYLTQGSKISGVINFPKNKTLEKQKLNNPNQPLPVIVMLRGWVPAENYYSGLGTKNAAAYFAQNGFITIAPDFLGYGLSDPEPENSWEARFIKPVHVMELIKSLEKFPQLAIDLKEVEANLKLDPNKISLWGHSNGGQIALTVLEGWQEPMPTSLWAPVSAPFPYSILFYSDEHDDEGKEMRAWLAQFEQDYDVSQFSLTQHLDQLQGPILLHHGTADEAALISWSDEFVAKLEKQNLIDDQIDITYYRYPGADHNLRPVWNTAVKRDLEFFNSHFP